MTNIIISVISAFAAAVFTNFLYWRKVKADLQKEYASRFNQKKWDVYAAFTNAILNTPKAHNSNLLDISADLLIVGSDEVIQKLNQFSTFFSNKIKSRSPSDKAPSRKDREEAIKSFSSVFIAMRKDLGYNTKIENTELFDLTYLENAFGVNESENTNQNLE
jgi:hypothetical protein